MSFNRFFNLIGITIIMVILVLSLVPLNQVVVPGSDKLHHSLAYFACMFCWAQVYIHPLSRLKLAIVFIAMGALIECIQGLTPYRTFEWLDIVANSVGVVTAWFVVTVQLFVQRRLFKKNPGFHSSE